MMQPTPEELLYDAFLGTPEMEAWDAFVEQGREAIDKGAERVEMPTAFLALILPELSSPMMFLAFREAWNRLCDERGRPDLKKEGLGEEEEETGAGEDGPF